MGTVAPLARNRPGMVVFPHPIGRAASQPITERTMSTDRQPTFDAFRGLAILAVVALHCMDRPPGRADTPGTLLAGLNQAFVVLWKPWLVFAVPVFLFISGYFLGGTTISSWADYGAHLQKRLLRILVPLVVWWLVGRLVLAGLMIAYFSVSHSDMPDPARRELYFHIAGIVQGPYYFLIALAQLYIILPALAWLNRMELGRLGLLAFCIAWLVLRQPRLAPWTVLLVAPWLLYYQLGMLIGRRRGLDFRRHDKLIVAAFVGSGIAGVLVNLARLRGYAAMPAVSGISPVEVVYSCSVIALMLMLAQSRWAPGWLVWLGRYSFGIYLIHMLFVVLAVVLFRQVDGLWRLHPVYHAAVATTALASSLALIAGVRRVVPAGFCQKYLGF